MNRNWKAVCFAVLLAINGHISWAVPDSCEEKGRRPIVGKETAGVSEYLYSVDKEPPYKFSQDRYAHERFSFQR
jgi:hypothetical protein